MPTPRGWSVLAAGFGLWVASGALGVPALAQLGFGLIALVAIGVIVVRIGKHDIAVTRSLTPERVPAGRDITVGLSLANKGRGSAPLLLLEDHVPVELSGRARFAIRGIEPHGQRAAPYKLRPNRRGRYSVGPLEVTVLDPFGVARVRSELAGRSAFLAYPRTEPLVLPKDSGNRRTITVSARRQPTGSTGEDFYTLREYVPGDDLRRINWSATAKRNKYMIRQEETPWHARATVLLDDRSDAFVPASWERAVEAAASMVDLYHRSGYAFRLVQPIGPGVPSARGTHHFHRCLDLLATVETSSRSEHKSDLDPLLVKLTELESQASVEGVLIVITGTPTMELCHAMSRAGRRFKMVIAVVVPSHRYAASTSKDNKADLAVDATARVLDRAGVRTMTLGPTDKLGHSWSALWRVWGPAPVAPSLEEVGDGI